MPDPVLCKICGKRRARRTCPAVHGDICTICCGTEREVSLSCPLTCEYLQEAHRHEKPLVLPGQIGTDDIQVNESFLLDHEELLLYCVYSLLDAAVRTPGAIDSDVLVALEALIQTRRTLESGLVYESVPENSVAAAVQRLFSASLADYEKTQSEEQPLQGVRNSDVLAILLFLRGIGVRNQNGRPRGRMFLDLLRQMSPEGSVKEPVSSIIL